MRSAYWHTSPLSYDTVRKLSKTLGTSETMAAILARRGHFDPEAATRFLDADGEIHNPFLFDQMKNACERLQKAISEGEKICVHGDYDVDGITSTALMVKTLKKLGADVDYHLPNRFSEGYGVATRTVEKIAAEGCSVLLTVDCGISARDQLEQAAGLGMETIVVDHHRPVEGKLPPGIIISPLLCDYPFKELAGVGLAFKLCHGLLDPSGSGSAKNLHPDLQRQLDLVALGTIADVVPLLGENRSLVKRGLNQMSRTDNPGLKALMKIGKVERSRLNAGLLAFRIAPRINAAGRLDDPAMALELLLTDNEQEADRLAGELDSLNRERQKIENQMLAEAQEIISLRTDDEKQHRGYVLSSPGWHEGVIGIVASRMVELHHRPVIMISENEEYGKGSGRGIPPFDLHASLLELSDLLSSFGGHRAACGLTIDLENLGAFQNGFAAYADNALTDNDLKPSCYVDAVVCGRELTVELAEELARLEPFGSGNPSVSLAAAGARVKNSRSTRDGRHLQCKIETGSTSANAIGFGQAFLLDKMTTESRWDVVFRLERNEYNGSVSPQLNLRELFPRREDPDAHRELCRTRCSPSCEDGFKSKEILPMLNNGAGLPEKWLDKDDESTDCHDYSTGRVIDRRNYGGIPAQIIRLLSHGENVLLLVADVARRHRLVSRDLPLNERLVKKIMVAGSRCSGKTIDERLQNLEGNSPVLMLTDFYTATTKPELTSSFDHLVFIDPPFSQSVFKAIAAIAPDAYHHLFYCDDEVQFTKGVLEHEYSLRAALSKIYRHFKESESHPVNEAASEFLLNGGKYLRQPLMVVRCLKVLEELSLISIEEKEGQPIFRLHDIGKTELEKSKTFSTNKIFFDQCQKYLNKLKGTKAI